MSDNIILSINQIDPPTIEIVQSAPSNISILKSFASINDIPNFYESVDDRISNLLVAGSGVTLDYNDNANSLTIGLIGLIAPDSMSKAWVNFNGASTIAIRDSFNVSSITDNGTGDYTINFITPFTNTDYCFVTWSRDWNGDTYVVNSLGAKSLTTKTTSSLRLINNLITNGFNYDSSECNIIMFGN